MRMLLLEWVVTSVFLILAVLLLRLAFGRRVSGRLRYALWGLVLLRLLVPGQLFTSPVVGTQVFVGEQTQGTALPETPVSGADAAADSVTGAVGGFHAPAAPKAPAAPAAAELPAWLGWAWLAGGLAAGAVLLASNLRFAARLRRSRIPLEGTACPLPVYTVEGLDSPCLFGVLRPAVYITPETAADGVMLGHVTAHEYTHFRHLDHVWNLLRCVALAVHWWNPLVWAAVALSRADGELACDEGTLARLGDGARSGYGNTLLALVTAGPERGTILRCATTMAGDKRSLTERVKRIAAAPRPAAWAVALVVLAAVVAGACAFSRAQADSLPPQPVQTQPGPEPGGDPLEAVLRGESSFFLVTGGERAELTVDGVPALFAPDDPYMEIQGYAAVDLDRDGAAERVLRVCGAAGDAGGWVILHVRDGAVYGYRLGLRTMEDLKTDGTFSYSVSAGTEAGSCVITGFGDSGYNAEKLSWARGAAWEWDAFTVDGRAATEEEWLAAQAAQAEKPAAEWHELS